MRSDIREPFQKAARKQLFREERKMVHMENGRAKDPSKGSEQRILRSGRDEKLNADGVSKFRTENVAFKWKLEEQPN